MKQKSNKYVFFWRTESPFSNWHYSPFTVNEFDCRGSAYRKIIFTCAEQYMMYQKAMIFNDTIKAEQILHEKEPRNMKLLGRDVMPFDHDIWDHKKFDVVYHGLQFKFQQNRECYDALMETGDKILVEASPYDKIWGVGLAEEDPLILDEKNWKGENLLGKALMKVREEFIKNPVKW